MRRVAKGLATAAVVGMIGGQAFGQNVVMVGDAPIHKIDGDAAAVSPPAEPLAPPNTLNAQFAALTADKADKGLGPEARAAQGKAAEGPTVDIAPSLIDAAGAFDRYVVKAGAIDAKFADGTAVAKAVSTSAGYEIEQFQQGMVAYAALTALQEPDFVQAVWDLGRDDRDGADLAQHLLADPKTVMEIDGADAAAMTVGGILAQMGSDLVRAGTGARKAAYDVQHQAWSKEAAADPDKRLAEAKKISATKGVMTAEDTTALMQSLVALRKTGPSVGGRAPAPSPVVMRGLALAALAVLGRAGEEDVGKLAPLLTDAKSEDCMKMAKLNLYQCLAVAGPHYEHAFCLGQHALMDTGQCIISASGQSTIPGVTPVSAPIAPKKSRSISVPVALGAPAGPERARAYARPAAGAAVAAAAAAAEAVPEAVEPPAAPAQDEDRAPRRALALAPPPARDERAYADEAPAPRESARDERYDRDEDGYVQPNRPVRRAQRDDRYADDYGRDPRYYRQDYDPYADPYYGPPAYAYRFGR